MMWSLGTVAAVFSVTGRALQNGSVAAALRRGLEGLAFSSRNAAKSMTSHPPHLFPPLWGGWTRRSLAGWGSADQAPCSELGREFPTLAASQPVPPHKGEGFCYQLRT